MLHTHRNEDQLEFLRLSIAVCKIRSYIQIPFKMRELETEGQGHDVQHFLWRQSMANIDIYKNRTYTFFASSHRFPDIK